MIAKDTGERVKTSVKLHLEFTRRRKEAHKAHYRQTVRLAKWRMGIQNRERGDSFSFNSSMMKPRVRIKGQNHPTSLILGQRNPPALVSLRVTDEAKEPSSGTAEA